MEKPLAPHFTNGDNVHFDYSISQPPQTSGNKKKKKKKKNKTKSADNQFAVYDATINDPEADYPTSRVIKVGSNGDVIVESLDDEYPLEQYSQTQHQRIDLRGAPADSIFRFKDDAEKAFWANLPEPERREILRINPSEVLERFRLQKKAWDKVGSHRTPTHKSPHDHQHGARTLDCSCAYCGRNSRYIEEELENAYQHYLDDLVDYVQNVRQPDELSMNAARRYSHEHSEDVYDDAHHHHESASSSHAHEHIHEHSHAHHEQLQHHEPEPQYEEIDSTLIQNNESPQETQTTESKSPTRQLSPAEAMEMWLKAKVVLQLITPTAVEELVKYELLHQTENKVEVETLIDESAKNLTQIFANIKKEDENGVAKAMEFVKNCSRLYRESSDQFSDVSDFLSSFADLILKNDGRSFVDMLESLSDARSAREKLLDPDQRIEEVEEDAELLHYALAAPTYSLDADQGYQADHHSEEKHVHGVESKGHQSEEYESEFEDDYHHHHCNHEGHDCNESDHDCDHDCDHDHDHDHDHECDQDCGHDYEHDCEHDHGEEFEGDSEHDDYDDDSEAESEHTRREKIEEVRGFFMLLAVQVISERFSDAYEKKVSEDRTQKFIEELEAEELAKKEKEAKKLQQKEKQREKKRLQQLAKEEERKKQEEEALQKANDLKKKEEEARAEQRRKKEETRLKKEEEKAKKIEALKRRELEQQRAAEERRKKEEEARAAREEKKRIAEEERKAREAERENQSKIAAELKKSLQEQKRKDQDQLMNAEAERIAQEQELLARKTSEIVLDDHLQKEPINPRASISPVKNHLLDQLYQAKPRPQTAATAVPFNNSHMGSLSLIDGTPMYSPSKTFGTQDTFSSWGSLNTMGAQQPQTQSTGASFSPFGGAAAPLSDNWGTTSGFVDPFQTNPIATSNRPPANSSMWSGGYASRNNLIWNNSGSSTIWANSGNGQHANGTGIPGTAQGVTNNGPPGLPSGPPGITRPPTDGAMIQTAAYEAFQLLQSNNQVSFGIAPVMSVFQIAKGLLNTTSLGLAEFLGPLPGGRYQFEFVYDDFGNVTHLKLGNSTPPQTQMLIPQSFQQQQPLQQPPLQQPVSQLGMTLSLLQHNAHESETLGYDVLSGSVQGLLNQLGFGQVRGGIW